MYSIYKKVKKYTYCTYIYITSINNFTAQNNSLFYLWINKPIVLSYAVVISLFLIYFWMTHGNIDIFITIWTKLICEQQRKIP